MASELLKNKTLIQRLKEDKVPAFNFDLAGSALDYNIESIEEELLPKEKPQELFDERDRLQIESLEQSLQDNKPFLMDESVDFIKREEFNQGNFAKKPGFGTPVGTYPKTSPADLKKIRDYLKNLPSGTNVGLQTLQKETGVDRGTIRLIVQREFPNLNIGGTAAQSENMKKVNEARKAKGFRAGVNMEEYIKDYSEKFKLPKGSTFSKAMSNKDLAIKYFGDASEKNLARVDRINTDLRKQLKLTYPKGDPNKGYITREERKKKFTPSADDKYILNQQKKQKKALNTYFKNNPEEILNKPKVLQMIDAKLKDGKLDFTPRYDSSEKYVALAKQGKLFDEFDVTPIRSEKRGIMYPVNKAITPGKFNQAFIKQVDAYYKKTKGSNEAEVLTNKKAIENFLKEVGIRVNVEGQMIGEKVLPAIDRKTGVLPNIENTLEKLDLNNLTLKTPIEEAGKKKLTALQQLASGKNVGFDPILASKAGYQEFVKPAASIAKRGALTGADLLLSAGAGPIGLGVGALIETGQAMPELTRGNIKEAGRRTIIGSLLPESLVGSMQTDLLKLAETPEEKIAMKNFIDFEKDRKKYESSVTNLKYLENNPFEAEGIDLEPIRNKILERKADLEDRRDKVFFPEFGNIFANLVQRLDAQNVENLEGVLGSIVGKRGIDDREQIQQDIFSQAALGQEPFYGQAPVQMSPEELDEIYESGIMAMANGGRIGFADGPDDPSKRTFLKIMGGIASLPIVGKFFKSAKVAKVVPLKNTTTTMPEWFPQFVEKALAKGVSKKIDADLTEIEIPELPGVKVQAHDDGRILVEGKNAYNEPYEINYTPPGFELVDETTGKAVKTPGEFQANDTRYYRTGNPEEIDYDVDFDSVKDVDDILGGNATELEGFAKGTGKSKYTKGQKAVDEAEAAAEQDRYVGTEGRADVDEGPDIDLSDYED